MVNIPQIQTPKKGSFKIKRHHGYSVLLFIFGTVFPPLAVAARFGIGSDFFINLFLTICGYIPGHVHNFYIQNIRNNKNNRRTPKWAIRYGLVDDEYIKKKQRKSAWANRYDERLPHSTYEGREVEEGQVPDAVSRTDSFASVGSEGGAGGERRNGPGHNTLWREEDESFYSTNSADGDSGGRWHYPANFADAEVIPDVSRKRRKKKSGLSSSSSTSHSASASASKGKRDRWERSEDAYAAAAAAPTKKKRSSTRRARASEDSLSLGGSVGGGWEGPEDPLGAGYGRGRGGGDGGEVGNGVGGTGDRDRDPLAHEF